MVDTIRSLIQLWSPDGNQYLTSISTISALNCIYSEAWVLAKKIFDLNLSESFFLSSIDVVEWVPESLIWLDPNPPTN